MEWFTSWWNVLSTFEQILYCVALPSTLLLIIQTILTFIGAGSSHSGINGSDTSALDGGMDGGMDASDIGNTDIGGIDANTDVTGADMTASGDINSSGNIDMGGFRMFSLQGLVAFFCIFGWSGIAIYSISYNVPISVISAFILGLAAMIGVGKIIQVSARLAQNGNINVRNLIGETGTVYLPIPANGTGVGKVSISTSERFLEFSAVTDGEELPDNTPIRVTDIKANSILVVEKA